MKKKIATVLLAAALLCSTAFVGCGGGSNADSSADNGGSSSDNAGLEEQSSGGDAQYDDSGFLDILDREFVRDGETDDYYYTVYDNHVRIENYKFKMDGKSYDVVIPSEIEACYSGQRD